MADMNVGSGLHSAAQSSAATGNQKFQIDPDHPEASIEIVDGSYDANKGGIQVKLHYDMGDKTVTVNLRLECKDPSTLPTTDKLLAYAKIAKRAMSYHNIGLTLIKDPASLKFSGSTDATERLQNFFSEGRRFVCDTGYFSGRNTISICSGPRGDDREVVEPQFSAVDRMTGCWNKNFALRNSNDGVSNVAMEIAKAAAGCAGTDEASAARVESTGIKSFDQMDEALSDLTFSTDNSVLPQVTNYSDAAEIADKYEDRHGEETDRGKAAKRLKLTCSAHLEVASRQVDQAKVMLGRAKTELRKAETMHEAFSHTLGYDQEALNKTLQEAKVNYAQIACFLARASGDKKAIKQADKLLESALPSAGKGVSRADRGSGASQRVQSQLNHTDGCSIDTRLQSEFQNASDHLTLLTDPQSETTKDLINGLLASIPDDGSGDGLHTLRDCKDKIIGAQQVVEQHGAETTATKRMITDLDTNIQTIGKKVKKLEKQLKTLRSKVEKAKKKHESKVGKEGKAAEKSRKSAFEELKNAQAELTRIGNELTLERDTLATLQDNKTTQENLLQQQEATLEEAKSNYANAVNEGMQAAQDCLVDEDIAYTPGGDFGEFISTKARYDNESTTVRSDRVEDDGAGVGEEGTTVVTGEL